MSTKKRKPVSSRDNLVLKLLIIVALVLIIFEGRMILIMFSHRSSSGASTVNSQSEQTPSSEKTEKKESSHTEDTHTEDTHTEDKHPVEVIPVSSGSMEVTLAGLPSDIASSPAAAQTQPQTETESSAMTTVSNPGSSAIVPEVTPPVDDSYFSDAVFIGDSRMEGFRNASGITQGQFFTSIGMSLSSMTYDPVIQTAQGNITVAAALSGGRYNKIYIMLGTNDLGEYDWDSFRDGFISVTKRFQEIQPNAIFYICSVIYVEEAKVPDTTYINNKNVDKINSILLNICETQGYHYLDLNEIFSNGYGSLKEGISSDGVHMYENYCKQMLTYLKNHYVSTDTNSSAQTSSTESAGNETAASDEE